MKILFTVEFYEPQKGGAEEVVKQLAERLFKKGHEVTVATSFLSERKEKIITGVKIEEFKLSGNLVKSIKGAQEEIERYQKYLLGDFDVIINYAAQIWTTDLMFGILKKIKAKKILVPCGYSGLNSPLYQDYFKKLPGILEKYDKLVYMSANYQDKLFGDTHGLFKKGVIIPNGASREEFLQKDTYNIREKFNIKTKYLLIGVANHYKSKGHDFVIEAFLKMKRNDAVLLIIGEHPNFSSLKKIKRFIFGCFKNCWLKSKFHKNIILLDGQDRSLVVSVYKQADLFLFGSKIECAPLVLYESFASRTPFISTPVGNVTDYADIVKVVKTTEEMAEMANYLLNHKEERKDMADKAFALWRESYTWDKIAELYEEIIKK